MIALLKEYRLNELIGNSGAFSYRAIHLKSQRDCMVHLLVGDATTLRQLRQQLAELQHAGEKLLYFQEDGTDVVVTLPLLAFNGFTTAFAEMKRSRLSAATPFEYRTGEIGKELLQILDNMPPPSYTSALPQVALPPVAEVNTGTVRRELLQFVEAEVRRPAPAPVPQAPHVHFSPPPPTPASPADHYTTSLSGGYPNLMAPSPGLDPWQQQELAKWRTVAICGWACAAVLFLLFLAALLGNRG